MCAVISLVPDVTSLADVMKRMNLSDLKNYDYRFFYETSPWEKGDFSGIDYDYNIFIHQIDRIYFCEVIKIVQHERKLRYLLCRTKRGVFIEFGYYVPDNNIQQITITGSIVLTRDPFFICKLIDLPMDKVYTSLRKDEYKVFPPNLQHFCYLSVRKIFYQLLPNLPKNLQNKIRYFNNTLDATYEIERKSRCAILPFYSRSEGSFLLPLYL